MIPVTRLGELRLEEAPYPGRPAHLSAASGLVRVGNFHYVVADDENHIGVFPLSDGFSGELLRVFPGELPDAAKERKPVKPDLEALLHLPMLGALLAVPSGSKPHRRRGVMLALEESGAIASPPCAIDFTGLYAGLDVQFPKLNIEGAVILGDRLVLLHRGNKKNSRNACIHFDLSAALSSLTSTSAPTRIDPVAIHWFDLGTIGDIPLCFTDAAALPDGGFLFTAVAENTKDNYEDGSCAGAGIGCISGDGELRWLRALDPCHKVEGISAEVNGNSVRVLLVTDADDPATPAVALSADVKLTW
ncbi:DUF6929 family protein [Tahibacter amnicola]|uniref:DUF3616 domain-containing protein n=1 Tax=Tahibacter amnicola TaxID=2976241 RepID=A0ABY6BK95_9GAMM|nr:hypothetical protein [Tahibacter amnicola]UXI70194.1 hypothetical protein N4264_11345 [Tahibacter amnicola]